MAFDLKAKWDAIDWKPKFQAFAVHFGISFLIFLVLLYFLLFEWYPQPFFASDGGIQGLRLIIFVDLVLGPALTFIVFKIGKPSLKFDLSVIALVQIAALIYGVWVVQNERPAAIVFADDRFHPIPYYQLAEAGYKSDELELFGDDLPVRIYVEIPPKTEPEARAQLFFEVYQSKIPLFLTGKLYRKLDDMAKNEIARQSIDVPAYLQEKQFTEGDLKTRRAELQKIYDDFIASADKPASEYLFLALYARHCKCILVAEKSNLDFITVLEIPPPWLTRTELKVSHD